MNRGTYLTFVFLSSFRIGLVMRAYSNCETTKDIERNKAGALSWMRVKRWRCDGGGGGLVFGWLPWKDLVVDRRRWRRRRRSGGDERDALFISFFSGGGDSRCLHLESREKLRTGDEGGLTLD